MFYFLSPHAEYWGGLLTPPTANTVYPFSSPSAFCSYDNEESLGTVETFAKHDWCDTSNPAEPRYLALRPSAMIEAHTASLKDRVKERRNSGRWKIVVRHYFDSTGTALSAEPVRMRAADGTVTWIDEGTLRVLIGEPLVLKDAPNWRAATHWIDNVTNRLMQKRPQLVETPMVVRQCSGSLPAGCTLSAAAPLDEDGRQRKRLTSTLGEEASLDSDRPLWRSVYTGEIATSDPMAEFEQPKSGGRCACCGPRCQAKEEAGMEKAEGVEEDQSDVGDAQFTNSESRDRMTTFVPHVSLFAASDSHAATPSAAVVVGVGLEAAHQEGIEMRVISTAAVHGREGPQETDATEPATRVNPMPRTASFKERGNASKAKREQRILERKAKREAQAQASLAPPRRRRSVEEAPVERIEMTANRLPTTEAQAALVAATDDESESSY
jgi:hypothetical protein